VERPEDAAIARGRRRGDRIAGARDDAQPGEEGCSGAGFNRSEVVAVDH
jgi:hypothetical protein